MSEKETQQGNRFFGRELGWKVLHFDYLKKPHDTVSAIIYVISFILILYLLAFGLYFTFVIPAKILLAVNSLDATQSVDATKTSPADSINKLLLGLGGILAVPFLIWRTIISDKQNRIATRQAIIAQDNLHTTTMANAVEQLGAIREIKKEEDISGGVVGPNVSKKTTISEPNIEVRLGGIYLLEKLAREHEELHWPIMEILCAYVRENAGRPPKFDQNLGKAIIVDYNNMTIDQMNLIEKHKNQLKPIRVDIQAAITVIGRRSEERRTSEKNRRKNSLVYREFRLDLSNCDLAYANFDGLHFENAIFDNSNFEEASFKLAFVTDVSFSSALLLNTSFRKANGMLANFSSSKCYGTDFNEAKLQGTSFLFSKFAPSNIIDAEFDDALFSGTDMSDCSIELDSIFNVAWGGGLLTKLPDGINPPETDRWIDKDKSLGELFSKWGESRSR